MTPLIILSVLSAVAAATLIAYVISRWSRISKAVTSSKYVHAVTKETACEADDEDIDHPG